MCICLNIHLIIRMAMKKIFLAISIIFLTCAISNCQWYQKYYGVNDPSQLTKEQVNLALNKSQDGIKTGTTLLVIGSIGILTGAYLFLKDYPDEKYPDQAEMGKKFEGGIIALISLPPEIIGLAILKKNCSYKSEIEKFINNMEMQIGLCITSEEQLFEGPAVYFLPGVSINIRF